MCTWWFCLCLLKRIFYILGIESSIDSFNNNGSVTCKKAHSSIDEFPPDFFTEEQRRDGAVVVHIFVAFYGFIFITLICHDYFLPSVFCICLGMNATDVFMPAKFVLLDSSNLKNQKYTHIMLFDKKTTKYYI